MRIAAPGRRTTALVRAAGGIAALALAGAGLVGVAGAASASAAASADGTCASASPDFSSYGTELPGSTTLPAGWQSTGTVDYGLTSAGLRASNATAGSSLSLIAPRVATPASETTPGCDAFTASFTVAAVGARYQEGLNFSVALGDASRYGGVLGFRHVGGRLEVSTLWVPADATDADLTSWRSAVLATLDPAVPHTVTATVYLVPGKADDVLQVAVDGTTLAEGVFSWEPYAGVDPSQTQPHSVDTLLFRPWTSSPSADGIGYDTAPAQPATAGQGFVFSDIRYASFDGTAPTPATLTPCATPKTTVVDQRSGLLDTDLAVSPTRSLGGHAFTADGLHVWTTGAAGAPTIPTSESKSAGYLDVDLPLSHAASTVADVTVNSGSAPGLNLVLTDGRILVHEDTFGADTWWSRTPTPGLVAGPNPSYQRAFGTLSQWAAALPSATVDYVGYSLGSGAIGDATFRSLTIGCTTYSFVTSTSTPTPTPTSTSAAPTTGPTTRPTTGATPAPVPGHAAMLGTSTESLLAALRELGVTVQTPAEAGATISDAGGPVAGPVDASTPIDVSVPWTAHDTWVDVYLFSSRSYVGTFPVVDGSVHLTGVDLSALAAGTHRLVIVGQQTGAVVALALDVTTGSLASTGDGSLAQTGSDSMPLLVVALLFVVAGAALALVRRLAPGTSGAAAADRRRGARPRRSRRLPSRR